MTSLDKNEVYSAYSDGYLTEAEAASLLEYINFSFNEGVVSAVKTAKAEKDLMKNDDLKKKIEDKINNSKNTFSLEDMEKEFGDDNKNESSYTEGVLNGMRILKAKNAMKRVEKSKQKLLDEIRALKAKRDKLKIDADNTAHNMMGGIKAKNLEIKVNHVNNQIKKKLMEYNKLKAQTTSIDDEVISSEE